MGGLVGGVILGGILAIGSYLLSSVGDSASKGVILGAAMITAMGLIFTDARRFLPERACQVPRWYRHRWGPRRAAWLSGVYLGVGFLTHLVTPAFYLMVAVALNLQDPGSALLLGIIYGGVRSGANSVFAAVRTHRDPHTQDGSTPGETIKRRMRIPLAVASAGAIAAVLT